MKTVERIIGHKMGTGGSSGVSYLKRVLDQRFFPEPLECSHEIIKQTCQFITGRFIFI